MPTRSSTAGERFVNATAPKMRFVSKTTGWIRFYQLCPLERFPSKFVKDATSLVK